MKTLQEHTIMIVDDNKEFLDELTDTLISNRNRTKRRYF